MRGDARCHFEAVRRAARAIEPCQRELAALTQAMAEVTSWRLGSGAGQRGKSGGTHPDPTAAAAQERIEGLSSAIAEKRAKLDYLAFVVGEALRTIGTIRKALGDRPADVIELYYVDLAQTWSEVADELGVSRETVRAERDRALTWLDGEG